MIGRFLTAQDLLHLLDRGLWLRSTEKLNNLKNFVSSGLYF